MLLRENMEILTCTNPERIDDCGSQEDHVIRKPTPSLHHRILIKGTNIKMLNTRWNPFEISREVRRREGIVAHGGALTSVGEGPPMVRHIIYQKIGC